MRRVGRCELFGRIARGGMASVYLGRWLGEGGFRRLVAVKSIHAHLAEEPSFRRMLLDEARIGGRVQHPNVVSTIDVVAEGDELFLVMDLIEGATLTQILARAAELREGVPMDVAKRILLDLLRGLHAAHETCDEHGEPLGVVHRDVAPDNVLLGVDGRARLLDFGISRAAGRLTATQPGVVKGKFTYLAPEQLLDQPITPRTDVYGAAVVGWQLVTNTKLFQRSSATEIAVEILNKPIPRPSLVTSGDDALDPIIMKGLERDPEARWETAAAMAAAIEAEGGVASRSVVATWVRRVAPLRLQDLSRVIRQIEALPPTPIASAGDSRLSLPTIETATGAGSPTPSPPRHRAGAGWFYGLSLMALAAGSFAFATGDHEPHQSGVAASAVPPPPPPEARLPVPVDDAHRTMTVRGDVEEPMPEPPPPAFEPKPPKTLPKRNVAAPAPTRAGTEPPEETTPAPSSEDAAATDPRRAFPDDI